MGRGRRKRQEEKVGKMSGIELMMGEVEKVEASGEEGDVSGGR